MNNICTPKCWYQIGIRYFLPKSISITSVDKNGIGASLLMYLIDVPNSNKINLWKGCFNMVQKYLKQCEEE